jgi:hypothetical protein
MKLRSLSAFLLCLVLLASFSAALAADGSAPEGGGELKREWTMDQDFTLADPAPWNLEELKQAVDVSDPRSVAAYFVWSVTRLTDSYDDGMAMMKYLFADINPYDPEGGYTEGGLSGQAGWDGYFNERLTDPDYRWLPRAYFEGAAPVNGFKPDRPLTIELYYNDTNTDAINKQTQEQEGRLNIVYWVMSHAGKNPNQVNIVLSRFKGSDRWYVTSGTSSVALFYDQRSGHDATVLELAANTPTDDSTAEEHARRYGAEQSPFAEPEPDPEPTVPFTDVPEDSYYIDAVAWAYNTGVTTGKSDTSFDPLGKCTRAEVVTFLWRAAGEPEPNSSENPFTDVPEGTWYTKAILWAVEQGITKGTSADIFSPTQTCSSAHIITFLYRAMGVGADGWGAESRDWAFGEDLAAETGLTISKDEDCPRSAVVAFLYRTYAEADEG